MKWKIQWLPVYCYLKSFVRKTRENLLNGNDEREKKNKINSLLCAYLTLNFKKFKTNDNGAKFIERKKNQIYKSNSNSISKQNLEDFKL